jgi:hypothetical protein
MNFPAASPPSGLEKEKPWTISHLLAIKLATCRSFSTPSTVTVSPSVCAKSTIKRTRASFTTSSPRPSRKALSVFKCKAWGALEAGQTLDRELRSRICPQKGARDRLIRLALQGL